MPEKGRGDEGSDAHQICGHITASTDCRYGTPPVFRESPLQWNLLRTRGFTNTTNKQSFTMTPHVRKFTDSHPLRCWMARRASLWAMVSWSSSMRSRTSSRPLRRSVIWSWSRSKASVGQWPGSPCGPLGPVLPVLPRGGWRRRSFQRGDRRITVQGSQTERERCQDFPNDDADLVRMSKHNCHSYGMCERCETFS